MSFFSRTFTIHRTAEEGEGYLFNPSLPLPPAPQTVDINWAISVETSFCTWLATGVELGTFDFRAQVAYHQESSRIYYAYEDVWRPIVGNE